MVEVPANGASPEEVAEASEERSELHEAILRLAADRQQLLVLKFSQQLSNEEIATIMGRSEGAIKALLHRTVKGLRDDLSRKKAEGHTKGAKT
jgi:RNA polymerase sigma-70 factor (ECF subfamily)